jgi:hypothetical protein
MTQQPTTYELMQLYREWFESRFGNKPNSQAVIHAADFARHALAQYGHDDQ